MSDITIDWGYARCSTREQDTDGYSIEYQTEKLIAAGISPDNIVSEVASGGSIDRPMLDDLLGKVRSGDTITVQKLDRFGRTTAGVLLLVDDLTKKGVGFRSLAESFDTTTAFGKASLGMLAVFAEFERNMIRERTMAGLEVAREKGRKGGRPRMDEATVKQALTLYQSPDYSVREICKLCKITAPTLYRYVDEAGLPRRST